MKTIKSRLWTRYKTKYNLKNAYNMFDPYTTDTLLDPIILYPIIYVFRIKYQ